MKIDGKVEIAQGTSAGAAKWTNKTMLWSELTVKLCTNHKKDHTSKVYHAASKPEKAKMKSTGAYVGAFLNGGKRGKSNVSYRTLITLDLDYAHLDFWEVFQLTYDNAAVIHTTHSHTEENPKYRLIMPMSRTLSSDEYEAVARRIAGDLDIELFDNTGFQNNRLMYWPSTPVDAELEYNVQEGEFIDVDEVLDSYVDWKDQSQWPVAAMYEESIKRGVAKQEHPHTKRGNIGIFCRAYTVSDALDRFLTEEYVEASDGRYTFTGGSTAGGLVIYDDLFAFSHHGTDPTSGKLCNVYDLVRVHKFGHLDTDKNTKISTRKMVDLMTEDDEFKMVLALESLSKAEFHFGDEDDTEVAEGEEVPEIDVEDIKKKLKWTKELEVDHQGKYASSAGNLKTIFENDPILEGAFRYNEFDNKQYLYKSMPWRKIDSPEPLKNVDYSGIRSYVERAYKITGNLKIEDAHTLETFRNGFHPVKEYLSALEWDGKPRLDELLIKYYRAEDNIYTRDVTRKTLVAAVARIFNAGVKFDMVLTLVGLKQGNGKSTLLKKLGGDWASDSFNTIKGKEAFEQLQGAWLVEMAELAGPRKQDLEAVKHYLSKSEDAYRPAYGRATEVYKRQCIFVATTNSKDFLNDPSGNRRFNPIDVNLGEDENLMILMPQDTVNQIWAEAVVKYKAGEALHLSGEANKLAKEAQKAHSVVDDRAGIVDAFLNQPIPVIWDELGLTARREFLSGLTADEYSINDLKMRETTSVIEIWCECFGKDQNDIDRRKSVEIGGILRGIGGWAPRHNGAKVPLYGRQRLFDREHDLDFEI